MKFDDSKPYSTHILMEKVHLTLEIRGDMLSERWKALLASELSKYNRLVAIDDLVFGSYNEEQFLTKIYFSSYQQYAAIALFVMENAINAATLTLIDEEIRKADGVDCQKTK